MIRLALIGCGGMSRSFTQRFDLVKDRIRLVAAVDPQIERAEAAASMVPGARAETDHHRVLDGCDAGLLVLPHHLHHPIGLDFLNAGKHVLLEKPMANTEQQCLDLIEAADRNKRVLMIAYIMRYHPLCLALKRAIDDGVIGNVFTMSLWTEQYTKYGGSHWVHSARTLGGGQLFSHGCHYIDLLLWYLGRPMEGSHMGTNYGTPWMEKEGTSHVTMRFESGALGYHAGTWGARGTRLMYAFHAHGERGMLEAEFSSGRLLLHRNPHIDEEDFTPSPRTELYRSEDERTGISVLDQTPLGKQAECEMLHFVDCIENGRTPETDGRRSLQSLQVIWRLYDAEARSEVADLRGLGLPEIGSPIGLR